ncbi:MAG: Oxidoreductase, short-chain dehydrogenase/reductase family [uncultured Paraburkholderia sp.]|nr:MAG: Oxidoreductase, short-chain dehydrogenase/reductase family [uncultured Paraburkholderia sp.]CAH2923826.1 MAG: Oxidoreductase, short-chain dehydrogenase/reductase family [uncultured Paraburkholderia sp.]
MSKLAGKVAIVTGASKGIGAGIAARVVVNYARTRQDADRVMAQIRESGGEALAVQADIAVRDGHAALVDAALETYGQLDILVNNAGVYQVDSLEAMTADSIDLHFDLNVRGLLLMTQAAARALPEGGVIVNISSGVAKSPSPMAQVYCSTKGAVDVLTRTLGTELGTRKIRVVGIAPGYTETEGNRESAAAFAAHLIAAAVSFAVSEDANWVTACTLDVAGGLVF